MSVADQRAHFVHLLGLEMGLCSALGRKLQIQVSSNESGELSFSVDSVPGDTAWGKSLLSGPLCLRLSNEDVGVDHSQFSQFRIYA